MTPSASAPPATPAPAWPGSRRAAFFSLWLLLVSSATWVLADILWRGGVTVLEGALLVLFVPLFAGVAFACLQAAAGFFLLVRGDPLAIHRLTPADRPPDPRSCTALLFPICNEDVSRVYEGLRTMYLDLARRGWLDAFDFFILSDSSDATRWIEEEASWVQLCRQLGAFGRIFYRKRPLPLNRKSGNVSDFCRRWGARYRYMIILDADSLMEAGTLRRLVALMDAHPTAGIVQTVPQLVGGTTLFARMIQFAAALYGPVFASGLSYWQMDEGNYWGHNAIIRVQAFIAHCALPAIPVAGRRARFMSHDYVEAALMRKAGYAVWLATDLGGSYEGVPPTVMDHALRDRRWCRGNLQHSWLLLARGLHPVNKLHLLLGIMAYLSSVLWFAFLLLGTLHAWRDVQREAFPRFDDDVGLTSFLDIGGGRLALSLFGVTVALLLLPKLMAILCALARPDRRRAFGGAASLLAGALAEQALSVLLAPVHMLFHTQAVLGSLLGQEVAWLGQARARREDSAWRDALAIHASHTVIGCAWALIAYAVRPDFFLWLSPVWLGLLSSVPLSLLLARESPGRLFRTPCETAPPAVLAHLQKAMAACRRQPQPPAMLRHDYGLLQAVLDPYINAVHVGLLRKSGRRPRTAPHLEALQERLLRDGPQALADREKTALMRQYPAMDALHRRVWETPYDALSPWWRLAMRQYNTLTASPPSALYR